MAGVRGCSGELHTDMLSELQQDKALLHMHSCRCPSLGLHSLVRLWCEH
jgi:hypothetical protein